MAAEKKRRVVFFSVEERFGARANLPLRLIGEQPVWDPARWQELVSKTSSIRAQLSRARAKGITVRNATPAELFTAPREPRTQEFLQRVIDAGRM